MKNKLQTLGLCTLLATAGVQAKDNTQYQIDIGNGSQLKYTLQGDNYCINAIESDLNGNLYDRNCDGFFDQVKYLDGRVKTIPENQNPVFPSLYMVAEKHYMQTQVIPKFEELAGKIDERINQISSSTNTQKTQSYYDNLAKKLDNLEK
jgi:hypothetical protein